MNSNPSIFTRPRITALLATTTLGVAALGGATAQADGGSSGKHRIDRTEGRGAKAADAARHRMSGRVTSVMEDRGSRERYEVTVRKGKRSYEVDVSGAYRVLGVHRHHGAGHHADDPAGHDVGDDHGVDPAGHDVGDDHGVDPAGHDVGDDHGVDPAGHDAGDDHGDHGAGHQ